MDSRGPEDTAAPPALREAVRARLRERTGEEPTEEELDRVQAEVLAAASDDRLVKMAKLVKDGKAAEGFKVMNDSLGLQGALGMFEGLIANCPQLTEKRKRHLRKQIKLPHDFTREVCGRFDIEVGNRKFYLCSGAYKNSDSYATELAKLPKLKEGDLKKFRANVEAILFFTRVVFAELIVNNETIMQELLPKLGAVNPGRYHFDEVRVALYFRGSPEPDSDEPPKVWEPMAGIFITEVEQEA